MHYVVCIVPLAPIRIQPDHKSEMMSQLLFGEYAVITEVDKSGWVKIIGKADGYTGWCQQVQLQQIDITLYESIAPVLAAGWSNELDYDGQVMIVPFGSSLNKIKNGKLVWGKNIISFAGETWKLPKTTIDSATIEDIAFTFINTPYVWGGRSVFGIDCSGFVQAVYKFLNIALLRDAHQQVTQGEVVSFLQQANCGDLAFFDNVAGEIIHVGILLNEHEIIHASGKVRIDKIDNEGIVNIDTGERTHRLRVIKRHF